MVVHDALGQRHSYLSPRILIMDTLLSRGDWSAFQQNPLSGLRPEYLAQCLEPLLIQDEALLRRKVAADSHRAAFMEMVQQTLGLKSLSSLTPSPLQISLLSLDARAWQCVLEACGLMYWAPILAQELRAPVLRALETRFGPTWWAWVQTGCAVLGENVPEQQRVWPDTAHAWKIEIVDAGNAVLNTWIARQEEGVAAWLRCKQAVPVQEEKGGQVEADLAMVLLDAVAQTPRTQA